MFQLPSVNTLSIAAARMYRILANFVNYTDMCYFLHFLYSPALTVVDDSVARSGASTKMRTKSRGKGGTPPCRSHSAELKWPWTPLRGATGGAIDNQRGRAAGCQNARISPQRPGEGYRESSPRVETTFLTLLACTSRHWSASKRSGIRLRKAELPKDSAEYENRITLKQKLS